MDKAPTYGIAIGELKKDGKLSDTVQHRQVKYLNNVIEAHHGKLKQLIRPVRAVNFYARLDTGSGFAQVNPGRAQQRRSPECAGPDALFFNQLGELRDRRFENQAYRALGLNLLVVAVILWNTCYLQSVIATIGISDALARHIALLGWEHISLTGDYRCNVDAQPEAGALRPLRVPTSLLVA